MARRGTKGRPGRALVIFFVGVLVLFGLTFLGEQTSGNTEQRGKWQPALGLDLQGGTRITLTATNDPSAENLEEARAIIDQRVNGSGVAEAEVTTQSGRFIIVEIPGDPRSDLVDTVKRQAQLRFRIVACSLANPGPCAAGGAVTDPTAPVDPSVPQTQPGDGVLAPTESAAPSGEASPAPTDAAPTDAAPTDAPTGAATPSGTANRAPASYATTAPSAEITATASPDLSDAPSASADPSDPATASPSVDPSDLPSATESAAGSEPIAPPDGGEGLDDPLTWSLNPGQSAIDAWNALQCPTDGTALNVVDDPDQALVTCGTGDDVGNKYLLSPAMIEGTDLTDASAGIPQQQTQWVVNLAFNGQGTREFTNISRTLVGTERQFAVVLDGQVISAPTMDGLITNGQAQISGSFTQETAQSLATSLQYGALPIAFERNPTTELVGPSLAGDQLSAGILAGGIGLALVMLYALLYYRGLGLVVLGSLVVAAILTYLLVLLLGATAGFTLTLPGIAGLIIGVGVTADSFIIFFERIRDEMREGKSMRVAVETGWIRARKTRMAANVVSLLSALVLYIFATGVVKGFGFALGLSTLIDLAVLFWFTKPFVSWLARFRFFNGGGNLSGLSLSTLGMDAPATTGPAPATRTTTAAGSAGRGAEV